MQELFPELLQLSLIGSLFAFAVMVVRLAFRKAPKWIFVLLWGVVALRLVFPFTIESGLSLVPDRLASGQIIANVGSDYVGEVDVIYESNAGYGNAVEAGRQPVYSNDGYYVVTQKDSLEAPKTVGETVFPILSRVWLAGMALMLAYTAVSYTVLKRKMREATLLRDNIWQCEQADSPFVLGLIRPRIYLPYVITEADIVNVIAHEQAHIRRKDHWWKPIGFLLLSVYWFNPVMWVAYILLCRDIEAACDEKVIRHMEKDEMRAYSTALLHCSIHRRRIAACPLAFGEAGVKERIKRVMNYKKPAFRMIAAAALACAVVAVCFLTNPTTFSEFAMSGNNVSDLDVDAIIGRIQEAEGLGDGNAYVNSDNFSLTVDSDFDWVDSQAVRYFFYKRQETHSAQLRIFPDEDKFFITESYEWAEQDRVFLLRYYLDAAKYLPQEEIRQMAPADRYIIWLIDGGKPADFDRVITYSAEGVGDTDGWLIHLRLEPCHANGEGFSGTGEEAVDLFYGQMVSNNRVTLTETVSDTQESSCRVSVNLPGSDLSSPGQMLAEKIEKEWDTFDGMTQQQRLLSSHLWGTVYIDTDTWSECEKAIGITVANPLEHIDWIEKTGYIGMESVNPDISLTHVKATAYAAQASNRQLSQIEIQSGYCYGDIRITLTATICAEDSTFTTGMVIRGCAAFDSRNAVTGSGLPVAVVTPDMENNTGYYNEGWRDQVAYWAAGNVFYALRVVGDDENWTEMQNILQKLLTEI